MHEHVVTRILLHSSCANCAQPHNLHAGVPMDSLLLYQRGQGGLVVQLGILATRSLQVSRRWVIDGAGSVEVDGHSTPARAKAGRGRNTEGGGETSPAWQQVSTSGCQKYSHEPHFVLLHLPLRWQPGAVRKSGSLLGLRQRLQQDHYVSKLGATM